MTLTEFVMKFKKLLTVLIYFISIGQVYAADVTISGTQATREDLQDSSTLTISGTLDGDLNNIVRGYIYGNDIDNATIEFKVQSKVKQCYHG